MRGLILSSAATTPRGGHGTWPAILGSVKVGAGPAARLSVNVAPGQFRMILTRKRSSGRAQGRKQLGLKLRGTQGRKGAGAQAMGRKLPDHGSWTKYQGARRVGLNQDERVGGVFDMEANLVW